MADEPAEETPDETAEPASEESAGQVEAESAEAEQPVASDVSPAEEAADPSSPAASEEPETAPVTEAAPAASEEPEVSPVAEATEPVPSESETAPELTLGDGPPAEADDVPLTKPIIRGKIDRHGVALGTGRRKTSVARVRISEGNGDLEINGRSLEEFFRIERDRKYVEAPLHATETYGKVNVWVRVQGGGTTGQAGAIVLGIARALQAMDPSLHHFLAEGGYLTRDSRMVERKKYGYKKARKSFQFSKR